MAIKIHGVSFSTCTARVVAVLNEKGVEYELIGVNLPKGEHKQPPFLALNPFGQIPVLEDGDLRLYETRAITKYLAYKYKDQGTDLVRIIDPKYVALVNVWAEVEAQHFNAAVAPLVEELLIKPRVLQLPPDEAEAEIYAEKLDKVLTVYEERLSKSKYLAGDYFSLADLHHLPYLHCLLKTSRASLVTSRPHVLAWWEDISSRPAWVKTAEGMKFWDAPPQSA
ncbi:glutathione S-transferase F13-like [Aristolochia californica]|uniref:glutathione S-transferase F13-like n=1 Tax=Aristolochia californica TaxID=171875 RepID=UPI0035E0230B